jgi:hypothetical protein
MSWLPHGNEASLWIGSEYFALQQATDFHYQNTLFLFGVADKLSFTRRVRGRLQTWVVPRGQLCVWFVSQNKLTPVPMSLPRGKLGFAMSIYSDATPRYINIWYTATRRVQLEEQELSTLPEHLSSPPVFSGIHVGRALVFCVVFCRFLFVLLSFGHCVVCPFLICGFWLPLWCLQTLQV